MKPVEQGESSDGTVEVEALFAAGDGTSLAASVFHPRNPNGSALLINSGTGIPRRFYAPIARFFAARGFGVATYDYRGTFDSAAAPASAIEAWGRDDQASMIDQLALVFPGTSVGVLGHSLGGQILGLASNIGTVKAAVLVASQSGHWRLWRGSGKLKMWLLWHVLIPGSSLVLRRFPGSWFGTADLPSGIARSWAAWGRSPHYICDESGRPLRPYNDQVTCPIRWLSFSDDAIAPLAAVQALHSYYPGALLDHQHLSPADLGVPSIGHFGFFKPAVGGGRWDELARWFERKLRTGR